MINGLHAWEFISGFQRRLQDVSFRIVAAMLVWSGLASCMRPHIVFALGQEGAATKSLTFHVRSVHVLTGLLLFPFLHALVIWFFLLFSHSFLCMHAYYGAFQKSELKQNWPAGTGHFENEIGFFQEITNGKRFPSYMVFRIWLICRSKVKFSLRREWPGRPGQQN